MVHMDELKDERRGEIVPSRTTPDVRFFADDLAAIAYLSWKDADTTVCHQTEMSYPLREIQMFVLGSDKRYKDYSYQTEMLLREPNDQDSYESFFGILQKSLQAVELNHDPGTNVFQFPEGAWYTISFEPITGRLELSTAAGRSWSHPSLNALASLSLQHESDNELDSLKEFIQLNEFIIGALYSFVGDKSTQLRLKLGAIAQPHKETENYESEPQPAETQTKTRKITLDDLGGMEAVKSQFRDAVIALEYPGVLAESGVENVSGILLYGPTGTGKTELVYALANEINAEVLTPVGDEIYGKYMGESEKGIRDVIERALSSTKPTILLFDEIDGIIRAEGGATYETVAAIFKQEITSLSQKNPNVIVVATSNKSPNEFDPALVRPGRFDLHIYVPLPDKDTRKAIFGTLIVKTDIEAFETEEIDLDVLAEQTDGMSGAAIKKLVIQPSLRARKIATAKLGQTQPKITTKDLQEMIKRART